MLSLEKMDVYYGSLQALWGVSLRVQEGEVIALVGSNGAGKSTTLRAVSGLVKPRKGSVLFLSRKIEALRPDEIVRLGISMVPEGRELFPRMSVRENLELGAAYIPHAYSRTSENLDRIYALFPVLLERTGQLAGTLSGGEQQMLAIGRALMSRPRLLMLDEPSLGLAPLVVKELMEKIHGLSTAMETTILIVEQNVREAFKIVERVYVLKLGKIVFEERPETLIRDERLRKAYLA